MSKGYLNFKWYWECKKVLFTLNRVHEDKVVVYKLDFFTNDLLKMCASYIFHIPTRILTSSHPKYFNIFYHNKRMDVQQPPFSLRTCHKRTAAKQISSKCPSKLYFGTDMFTFDTCLRFTLTYKDESVQYITFKFKSTGPVYVM